MPWAFCRGAALTIESLAPDGLGKLMLWAPSGNADRGHGYRPEVWVIYMLWTGIRALRIAILCCHCTQKRICLGR